MFRNRSLSALRASLAGLFVLTLLGCGGDNDVVNTGQNGNGQAATSQVRVFNGFIPGAGVNGTINTSSGNTSLTGTSGLGFGQFTTTSSTVSSNAFNPSVTGAGFSTPLQLQAPATLSSNNNYTIAVAGQSGQTGATAPQIFVIPGFSALGQQIPAGQAAIRVINLSPGSPPLTLYNTVGAGTPTPVSSLLSNIPFGSGSYNTYAFVPTTMPYNLSLQSATNPGTTLPISGNGLTNLMFQPGQAYTVYVYGQQNNPNQAFNATAVNDMTFLQGPTFTP